MIIVTSIVQHRPVCGFNLRGAGRWVGFGILGWNVHILEFALVYTLEAKNKKQATTKDPQQRLLIGLTLDSPMAGSSGMRVLFEERGRVGRTWHSWLEFSSSVLLPTAHICSDEDTPRMLVSHSWSMLSSHLVGDVKHVIASQTFYVSTSNHCLLSTLAFMP